MKSLNQHRVENFVNVAPVDHENFVKGRQFPDLISHLQICVDISR